MTRQEYMANSTFDTFRTYYGQFVTPNIKNIVRSTIGEARIKASKDPHMNDIPLREWDRLEFVIRYIVKGSRLWIELSGSNTFSQAEAVCIAKEAARQIRENQE
jgi:hypothetical protein